MGPDHPGRATPAALERPSKRRPPPRPRPVGQRKLPPVRRTRRPRMPRLREPPRVAASLVGLAGGSPSAAGCGAVWLARCVRDAEVPGSNPGSPTTECPGHRALFVPPSHPELRTTEPTDSSEERLIWEADARRLRTARKRAGLTQAQLAHRLQVQQQAVSHWETGKVSVPHRTKVVVAELLGEDLNTILPVAPSAHAAAPCRWTCSRSRRQPTTGCIGVHGQELWQERRLTGVKVGRLVRFRPEHLDEYIERNALPRLR